jgi:hypothetical protein
MIGEQFNQGLPRRSHSKNDKYNDPSELAGVGASINGVKPTNSFQVKQQKDRWSPMNFQSNPQNMATGEMQRRAL